MLLVKVAAKNSISSFIAQQEKWASLRATLMPNVKSHYSVTSAAKKYGVPNAAVTESDCSQPTKAEQDLLKYMFDNHFHGHYHNLFQLAKLCTTIPVTSSECERTHSKK